MCFLVLFSLYCIKTLEEPKEAQKVTQVSRRGEETAKQNDHGGAETLPEGRLRGAIFFAGTFVRERVLISGVVMARRVAARRRSGRLAHEVTSPLTSRTQLHPSRFLSHCLSQSISFH